MAMRVSCTSALCIDDSLERLLWLQREHEKPPFNALQWLQLQALTRPDSLLSSNRL